MEFKVRYLLNAWSKVLFKKLTGFSASQEIPAFYGPQDSLLTYLLIKAQSFLEKLTGSQLVKKFPLFFGTRIFITALKRTRVLYISGTRPIQSTSSLIFKAHFNIIIPSMPR